MTQEDKELLLKDLCARLPNGIKIKTPYGDASLVGITNRKGYKKDGRYIDVITDKQTYPIRYVKPYLRPMSSMTEEEKKEFQACHCVYGLHPDFQPMMCNLANELNMFDWLNAHHFDYRGLIERGLALKAPNEIYNN